MSTSLFLLENQNKLVTVGIGEMKISDQPDEVLVTYALGSCIALTLYDPVAKVGGLIHCKLPTLDGPNRDTSNPFVYVDVGVPLMLCQMSARGAAQNRLIAKIFGSANVINDNGLFRIGEQNYSKMIETVKWLGISLRVVEIGGTAPRTVYLSINDGKTIIRTGSVLTEV